MPIFGVDVSKWQGGSIDWGAVYRAGVRFAICRASIGTIVDHTFADNVRRARVAGIVVGAYHFLYPASYVSPEAQADKFIATIGTSNVVAFLDVERDGEAQPMIDDVRRFVARWRERMPGRALLIYTNRGYWVGTMGNPKGSDLGRLWLSRWVSTREATDLRPAALYERVPDRWWVVDFGGWTRATILQFTNWSNVSGVSGRVDANVFPGSVQQFVDLGGDILIPDSATEDPELKFKIIAVPGGTARTLSGNLWQLSDGALAEVSPTRVFPVVAEIRLDEPLPPFEGRDGDYQRGYLIHGDHRDGLASAYLILAKDATYSPEPAVDCSAQVAAAVEAAEAAAAVRLAEVEAARTEAEAERDSALTDLSVVGEAWRSIERVVAERNE